jgi:hypothetical protein
MGWLKRDKERERFYLLPGQGGRAMRRKRMIMLQWAVVAGIFVSAVLGFLLYWIGKR